MKRNRSKEDLIYVSSPDYYPPSSTSSIYVYAYPSGTLVGALTGFEYVGGICSDADGNVWVTDAVSYDTGGYVYEYAHGATSPKNTLTDQGEPLDCSVESSTGDLAVSNYASIAIYPNASGSPTYYTTRPFLADNYFISYDGSGNLYFAPYKRKPAWLPNGGSVGYFHIHPKSPHGGLGWDGKYFTVLMDGIKQYNPSGNHTGKAVGTVPISADGPYYSIQGSLVAVTSQSSQVQVYNYPEGGSPNLTISGVPHAFGVAISVAPSKK